MRKAELTFNIPRPRPAHEDLSLTFLTNTADISFIRSAAIGPVITPLIPKSKSPAYSEISMIMGDISSLFPISLGSRNALP